MRTQFLVMVLIGVHFESLRPLLIEFVDKAGVRAPCLLMNRHDKQTTVEPLGVVRQAIGPHTALGLPTV